MALINNRLTNAGKKIIADSIASGQANYIQFTKIEIGDGSTTSEWNAFTNLINTVDTIPIQKIQIANDGSNNVTIRGIFTNSDITSAFYWKELGLFAIDKETGKEVLFSYGNAGNDAEYISIAGTKVIEKIVDLVICVANTDSVSITIPSGVYATKEDLDEVKGQLNNDLENKLGKTDDSKDNTVSFTEATEESDIASGDTHSILFGKLLKSIHVIKDGISALTESISKKLTIGDDWRPNLLINSDFKNPINQRKKIEYSTHWQYTIDRWKMAGDKCTPTIVVASDGLKIIRKNPTSSEGSWMAIMQFIEDEVVGKKLTLSYKLDGVVKSHTFIAGGQTLIYSDNGDYEIWAGTGIFSIPQFSVNLSVLDEVEHTLEWIKLEQNDHRTPNIPSLQAELDVQCGRYYQANTADWYVCHVCHGYLMIEIPTITSMRITPSLISDPNYALPKIFNADGVWVDVGPLMSVVRKPTSITLIYTTPATNLVNGDNYLCAWLPDFDSEI